MNLTKPIQKLPLSSPVAKENILQLRNLRLVSCTHIVQYLIKIALQQCDFQIGNLRETFFFNQVRVKYSITSSDFADFKIEDIDFEVGGKSKRQKQIENAANGFIVKDDIEIGYRNVVPLWQFGLLY